MKYKTRNDSNPQGLPKIYLTGHPEDCKRYVDSISEDILKLQNCAVFYDENPEYPEDMELFLSDLERMQMVVIVVSERFVKEDTFAFRTVFRHAMEAHIPVLPVLEEADIEAEFNQKCGGLQFLNPHSTDMTEISYEDKLKKFLHSVLIGDELAEKVRNAFDAYVFLSYRKKDRKYAQELMRLIHQNDFCRDIAIWYDEFLVPGENFNTAIQKAMEKSKLFALAVTPNLLENPNYVMTTEYPAAKDSGKPIIPVTLAPTDKKDLQTHYQGIPEPVDSTDSPRLSQALMDAIGYLRQPENDSDPQHVFFIGLAYLSGIDVEVNHERAVEMITFAAEHEQPEAMQKLSEMYQNGEGVMVCPEISMLWQKRLADVYQKAYEAKRTEDNCRIWLQALLQLGDTMAIYCIDTRNFEYALEAINRLLTMAEAADRSSRSDWPKQLIASLCSLCQKICMRSYSFRSKSASQARMLKNTSQELHTGNSTNKQHKHLTTIIDCMATKQEAYAVTGDSVKDLTEARQYLERAVAVREELVSRNTSDDIQRELIDNYGSLAHIIRELMKKTRSKALGKDAEVYLKKIIEMQERLSDGSVSALKSLKFAYEQLNALYRQISFLDMPRQIEIMHHVIALQERIDEKEASPESRAELYHTYMGIAGLYQNHKDYAKAREAFETCLAFHPQLVAESGVSFKRVLTVKKGITLQNIRVVYNSLIRICRELNAVSDAEFYETVLQETEEMFRLEEKKAEEAKKAESKLEVMFVSHDGNFQKRQTPEYIMEAIKSAKDCLAFYQAHEALADSSKACEIRGDAWQALGSAHYLKQEYAEAIACFEKSLRLFEKTDALSKLEAVTHYLGETCEMLEDYEGAKHYYQKMIIHEEKRQTQGNQQMSASQSLPYQLLAQVNRKLGDAAEETFYRKKAEQKYLNSRKRSEYFLKFRKSQGHLLIIHKNLGCICEVQGDADAARAHYEEAYAICQTMLEKYPHQQEYQKLLEELQQLLGI